MKGRNNKMKKSHLLILAGVLVLLVTMCIGISAEDTTVAKIGTTGYTSLAQAINAAKGGDTIIVTANTTLSETLEVKNKNITIKSESADDIKTITYVSNYITVTADEGKTGSLTLENITITKQTGSANGTYAILYPNTNGTVILNSGTTIKDSASAHAGAAFAERGGAIVMNDGALVENCSSQYRSGAFHVDNGSFTMNGGTISKSVNGAVGLGNGKDASTNATITLNGGTITGTTGGRAAVKTYNGTSITISDNVVFNGNTVENIQYVSGTTVNVKADSGNLKKALNLAFTNNENTNPTIILTKATEAKRETAEDNYFNDRVFSVEGNGNTLSIEKSFPMWGDKGHITFKNVTVEMDNFILGNNGSMTFGEGAILTTPEGGVADCVISIRYGNVLSKALTMGAGSKIQNVTVTGTGSKVINVYQTATVNLDGVEISGVNAGRLLDIYNESVLNLNSATIKDNTLNDGVIYAFAKTINVTNPSALTIENNGTNRIIAAATTNTLTVNVTGDWDSALTIDNKNYYVKSSIVAKTDAGLYESLSDAITATNNKDTVIYLLKDCDLNELGIDRSYILDGRGHTVNLKNTYTIVGKSNITLRNVIFDLKDYVASNKSMFVFWNGITFTLDNGAVIRNYTATGDTVFGSGCVFMLNGGSEDSHPTVIMKSGSLIEGIDCTNKDGNNGIVAYVGKCAVFEMQGGTIQDIKMGTDKSTTASNGAIFVANGGIFNMTGGKICNVKNTYYFNNFGSAAYVAGGGTMNMSDGLITGNSAHEGGAVYLRGTLNMSGGEISGNNAWSGSGIKIGDIGKLNISGDAKILNNKYPDGRKGNIESPSNNSIVLAGDFNGKIVVQIGKLGDSFGTVTSGRIQSINSIVNDSDASFACISGGKLIWTTKADLAIETDAGKYTKTGDETVYGVIRILTKSNSDAAVPVESFGTAYVKNGADETSINTKADYNFTKNETFENGKGYIVDVVDVDTGATYTYIPVSYYKIAGIDEMVYVTGTPVTFDVENAKDLGKDPADLNY